MYFSSTFSKTNVFMFVKPFTIMQIFQHGFEIKTLNFSFTFTLKLSKFLLRALTLHCVYYVPILVVFKSLMSLSFYCKLRSNNKFNTD